ncbi:hypothetical protein BGX38DRAFT_1241087, partial [Terfezia claveryi]
MLNWEGSHYQNILPSIQIYLLLLLLILLLLFLISSPHYYLTITPSHSFRLHRRIDIKKEEEIIYHCHYITYYILYIYIQN